MKKIYILFLCGILFLSCNKNAPLNEAGTVKETVDEVSETLEPVEDPFVKEIDYEKEISEYYFFLKRRR